MGRVTEFGARLRALRKLNELTQQELADLAGVSVSTISQVERGTKRGGWELAIAVARALHVDAAALLGTLQTDPTTPTDRIALALPAIREVLALYDCPPEPVEPPRSLRELVVAVDQACRMRLAARYVPLAELIPGLITEVSSAAYRAAGRDRKRAYWLLAAAYRCADAVAHKTGHLDLSAAATDRIRWAAELSGDELMVGTAAYVRAQNFFGAKSVTSGLTLINEAAEPLASKAVSDAHAASVYGALHARAAVLAAKGGRADDVRAHLKISQTAAAVMGTDREYYYTSFGPSNWKIHEAAALVELHQGAAALAAAEGWRAPADLPAERASHHLIDMARARLWERDFGGAISSLIEARRLAPQHTRSHPYAKQTVEAVLNRAPGRSQATLGLAVWLGLAA